MTLAERIVQRSPPVRRSLALLLLLLIAILAWRDFILPIGEVLTSQNLWRVDVRNAIAIASGRAAEVPILEESLKALPEATIWQQFYPDGDSVIVGTAFRGDIARYAAVAGVSVRSISPLQTAGQSGAKTFGMRVSAVATIGELTDFLTQLRRSPRYLRVDALRIVAPQIQMKNGNERLLVQLQIFSYSRPVSGGGE